MKPMYQIVIWFTVLILVSALNSQTLAGAVTDRMIKLDITEWKDYNSPSGSFINSDKEQYTYYDNGKVKTIISYLWNPVSEEWTETEKTLNVYSDTFLTEVVKSYFNPNGIWVDTLKKVLSYTDGLNTDITIYERSANIQPWTESERELRSYDVNGNLIENLYQEWHVLRKDWTAYLIETMTYDAENRITGYESRVWDFLFDDWVNYDKEVYAYGTSPVSEEYYYYTWNETTGVWDNYYKDYAEYTSDMLTEGFLSWYWKSGSWIELTKEIYEFDVQHHLVYYAEYEWNVKSQRWDYYDKETYLYDSAGNLTEFVDYDRQTSMNDWIENSRELYTYNVTVSGDKLILPFSDHSIIDLYFNSQITTTQIYYWDAVSSSWKDDQLGSFYYSDFNVVDQLEENAVVLTRCFPNPANTSFTMELDGRQNVLQVELYDLKGNRLKNWSFSGQNVYDVSQLPNGIYLVIVRFENAKTEISKLVKY